MSVRTMLEKRKRRRLLKDTKTLIDFSLRVDYDVLSKKTLDTLRTMQTELSEINYKDPTSKNAIESAAERYDVLTDRKTMKRNIRGILDVIVVAVCVAFGIRALFLQPFQIPTSSMQPTLYGIHYIDKDESEKYMSPLAKLFLPLSSSRVIRYNDAENTKITKEEHQKIYPYLNEDPSKHYYADGEKVYDGYLSTGDHLFVDRASIHFLPLKRGEVFIFNTEGIKGSNGKPLPGYYYIKRLVGLPGDTLKIVDDKLMIKPKGEKEFRPASDFSDKFNKINSFKGGYQGHIAKATPDDKYSLENGIEIPEGQYFALGDNTHNSLDSRDWGFVPAKNIIGRGLNIFWPISRRWGFIDTVDPIDVPTRIYEGKTQPSAMRLQ